MVGGSGGVLAGEWFIICLLTSENFVYGRKMLIFRIPPICPSSASFTPSHSAPVQTE